MPSQDPADVLPDGLLARGGVSTKQAELLQMINDHPGQLTRWYERQLDVDMGYVSRFGREYPEMFDRETVEREEGGRPTYRWRLKDPVRRALVKGGIIDSDNLSDLQNEAEEPSKVQRGNVSVTGEIDATGEFQTIMDRPHKPDPGPSETAEADAESTEDPADADADGTDESPADMPEDTIADPSEVSEETTFVFSTTREDALSILRQVDRETAERLFPQIVRASRYESEE